MVEFRSLNPDDIAPVHAAWDARRLMDMTKTILSGGILPPCIVYALAGSKPAWKAITGSHRIAAFARARRNCPCVVVEQSVLDHIAKVNGPPGGVAYVRDFAAFAGLLALEVPELAQTIHAQEDSFVGRYHAELQGSVPLLDSTPNTCIIPSV